ncbi:L-aspartate oxidase [Bacillus sp. OxB-1]|uniref:L-aspartate oxidase n=1 Tax=Bacillus sp. (strain OxB-1) TaxID=98228 RepID=UPI00058230EF|nr:L-aspartate oxidase [Bacillus sp. OxB-1]BAQ10966.1 L-aspartate oxidase [Bacillus sp. OxB-1]
MTYHCIIVGGGIAALQLAHHLKRDMDILLLTKGEIRSSNTYRAQGGIAAAVGQGDSPALHYNDTIQAGRDFHNYKEVADLVKEGPNLISALQHEGLHFDKGPDGRLALGMEGAHSRNRIVHSGGDASGKWLAEHLIRMERPGLTIRENRFVYELAMDPTTNRCVGVQVLDESGRTESYFGRHIILATGGVGGLYDQTSNDPTITGDGIALAYRAGAELVDMEFIQFHPTLLVGAGRTVGLVSEAVRGAGGRLVDNSGRKVMEGKHPLGDLAPRHIVAHELFKLRTKGEEVFLDITGITGFRKKFPTITELCEANGIPIATGKLPVAPGGHFLMGGIAVDTVGRTTMPGLYAIGETAATGVHGANRLASNSLLEGLYYGRKLALFLNELQETPVFPNPLRQRSTHETADFLPEPDELRRQMMKHAGIIRSRKGLEELDRWLGSYKADSSLAGKSKKDIQTVFMLQTAKLIAKGAMLREESRGAHIRSDFPDESEHFGKIHIMQSKKGLEMRDRHCEYDQITIHA